LGSPYAQNCLAYCYEMGLGIDIDNKQALHLYTLAAEQGYDKAQYNMGINYKYGKAGAGIDYAKARHWFELAKAQGDDEAERELERMWG